MKNKAKHMLYRRPENTREKRPSLLTVPALSNIKRRFDENIEALTSQFTLVDRLSSGAYGSWAYAGSNGGGGGNGAGSDRNYSREMEIAASKDVLRSQIVFLESALDHYVHEVFRFGLANLFNRDWPSTEGFDDLNMRIGDVMAVLRAPESKNAVFSRYIDEINAYQSFMKYRAIEKQLLLIGISMQEVLDHLERLTGESIDKKELESRLDAIVERRNAIVHRSDRKQRTDSQRQSIHVGYVRGCITTICNVVEAIHRAVETRTQ